DDFVGSRPAERAALDVVAVQIPSLNVDALQRIRKAAPDVRVLAIYQFATREAIALTSTPHGATPLQWPLTWSDLMRACATPAGLATPAGRTAPRRYTDHELVEIAARSRQRGFDAPRHLVALISDLNAFTDYATQCLTESDDPELFDRLREDSSYARAQLERALANAMDVRRVHST